jgi:Pyridoxamine 5'-phosphate oxidase
VRSVTDGHVQPNPEPTAAVNVVRQWGDGELLVPALDDVLPWELAVQHLAGAQLYWQVTQRPDTNAHVRPVFAVECDGMLCSTTSAGARKTSLLERHPRCSLAASTDGMDLVYEGVAVPVRELDHLERIAAAYRRKYGWPVTVTGDAAFDAPFAAPAAGPPPYRVYAFEPITVWGFGTDDRYATRSTRWDFDS